MRELRSNARIADAGETARVLEFASGEPSVSTIQDHPLVSLTKIAEETMGQGVPESSSPTRSESGSTPDEDAGEHAEGWSRETTPERGSATCSFLFLVCLR